MLLHLVDARGEPVSSGNERSLAGYEAALRQLQRYRGDPVATIDGVLAEDAEFIIGHIFRAAVMITMWERSLLPEIEATLSRLAELAGAANERERRWTDALTAWVSGDWDGMRARLDRLLMEHPRDALALQLGHIADFYHGDRDNLRGRVLRALPAWRANTPGYGFVLGMSAFGLEECGDYDAAEEAGRQALELEPEDSWSHHAVTHVLEMQARQEEGLAWMDGRRPYWAQADNTFSFHNWWHTALFNLDTDRIDAALAIYDAGIRPGNSMVQLEMVDAAALLWRMHLRGIDVGSRWQSVADAYERTNEAGFYVFNDMHAMMAYVATGRTLAAARLRTEVEAAANASTTNGAMVRAVGLAAVRGIEAFGGGRYAETIERLMPVRYRAHAFGGSHAQRDIIHRTLIEAALRAGDAPLAIALAAERTALKPHCPFSRTLWQRAAATAKAA